MKKAIAGSLLTVFAFVTSAAAANAAERVCDDSQTVVECLKEKFNEDNDQEAADKVKKTPSADQSPDSSSTVRDFLPIFFTSLGLGTVKETEEALTLTFNPKELRGKHSQWSLETRLHEPEPLEKLVMEAAEANRKGIKEEISETLGDFDDVEVSATYAYRSEKFGRDFEFHSGMAAGFLSALESKAGLSGSTLARQALVDSLGTPSHASMLSTKFSALPSAVADEFDGLVSAALEELKASRKGLGEQLAKSNYFRFANLVNNQPQLTASLKVRERDDLVGQDSVTANVTYEWGAVNVNRFKRWCGVASNYSSQTVDAGCLEKYWTEKGAGAEHLPRFKFSLEWTSLDDLAASFTPAAAKPMADSDDQDTPGETMPAEPLSLTLASSDKTVASAAYGRYLRLDDEGNQISRFDIETRYEYVEDDSTRNKRYVSTASYTQNLSDGASATLGLVYASDPEFRGEVEKELSARAGIKFKLDRKKEKKKGS